MIDVAFYFTSKAKPTNIVFRSPINNLSLMVLMASWISGNIKSQKNHLETIPISFIQNLYLINIGDGMYIYVMPTVILAYLLCLNTDDSTSV